MAIRSTAVVGVEMDTLKLIRAAAQIDEKLKTIPKKVTSVAKLETQKFLEDVEKVQGAIKNLSSNAKIQLSKIAVEPVKSLAQIAKDKLAQIGVLQPSKARQAQIAANEIAKQAAKLAKEFTEGSNKIQEELAKAPSGKFKQGKLLKASFKETGGEKSARQALRNDFLKIAQIVAQAGAQVKLFNAEIAKQAGFQARGAKQPFRPFVRKKPSGDVQKAVEAQKQLIQEIAPKLEALLGKAGKISDIKIAPKISFNANQIFSKISEFGANLKNKLSFLAFSTKQQVTEIPANIKLKTEQAAANAKQKIEQLGTNIKTKLSFLAFAAKQQVTELPTNIKLKTAETISNIKQKTGEIFNAVKEGFAPTLINTIRTKLGIEVLDKPESVVKDAVAPAMNKVAELSNALAKTNFKERIEWGQIAKGVRSEAEAAFSDETISRKISSTIFNQAKLSSALGFAVGKYLETASGIMKGLTNRFLNTITKSVLFLTQKSNSKIIQGVGALVAGVSTVLQGAITILDKLFVGIFGKVTLAFISGLNTFLQKKVLGVFKSLTKGIFRQMSSLKNVISNAFGSLFGGITGGSEDASGISGLIGIGVFGATLKLAGDLQEQLAAVSTITGQVGESFNETRRRVVELSNETGKSTTEITKALFQISGAGFRGARSMTVLRNALVSSIGGQTDVATSTSVLIKVLKGFDIAAEKSSEVIDTLFNIQKLGITTQKELAAQIPQAGAIVSAAGVSFKQFGAAIANLTRSGLTTRQTVIGLRQVFKSIIAPTDGSLKAAEKLGIAWDAATIKQKGFVGVIREAAPKLLANTRATRELIGDIQGVNAILKLSQNIVKTQAVSPGSLESDLAAMSQAGAAFNASAQIATTFNQQARKLFQNFLNILRSIGTLFLPSVEAVLQVVTAIVEKISSFSNRGLSEFLTAIKNSFKGIAIAATKAIAKIFAFFIEKSKQFFQFSVSILVGGLNAIVPIFKLIMVKIGNNIATFFFNTVDFLLNAFIKLATKVVQVGNNAIGFLGVGFFLVFTAIASAFKFVLSIINKIFQKSKKSFEDSQRRSKDFGKTLQQQAKDQNILEKSFNRFTKGFSFVQSFKLPQVSNLKGFVIDPIKNLGEEIVKASKSIGIESKNALVKQSEGLKITIKALEIQRQREIKAGQLKRAQVTAQFIKESKGQLRQIIDQQKEIGLNKVLKQRQELFKKLAVANRRGDVQLRLRIIEQIKNNFENITEINKKARDLVKKQSDKTVVSQISSIKSLTDQAKKLFQSSNRSVTGLNQLSSVLDNIFGKDISNIARRFGVGVERAAIRDVSKAVITAKAAGFSKDELDKIIVRGITQESKLLSSIRNNLSKSFKTLDTEQLKGRGVFFDLVKLVKRVEALGISEKGKREILGVGRTRGRDLITQKAFEDINKFNLEGDKETNLINKALGQFRNIEEVRKAQEERNTLQDRFNELTKGSVFGVEKLKQSNAKLKDIIAQIEEMQNQQNRVATSVGGPR